LGLPSNILEQCYNLTSVAPSDSSFESIKAFLLLKYEKSDLENSYDLLRYTSRSELTPTESLDKIERMWKDTLKKAFWLRSLEPELRNVLTGDPASLRELATKADAILLQQKAYGVALAVVQVQVQPIAVVAMPAVVAVATQPATRGKSKFKRKDYSSEPIVDATGLCYMHRKWGAKAYHCRGPPCTMVGQTTAKPQGN
jgi:hypothetical protein